MFATPRNLWHKLVAAGGVTAAALALLVSGDAQAVPAFARQTGQNCVACHAGGQFPELTPYGRMFKLTGYTIGTRTLPLSVMGVFTYGKVASTSDAANNDPQQTYAKNGAPLFATGSLLIAGKATDNIGGFVQITYDNYNGQAADAAGNASGRWQGHTSADNIDLRYANRIIDDNNDFIFGLSLNNNPSVTDPWNTAPAWTQYVPDTGMGRSHQFADIHTPYPSYGGYAGDDLGRSAGLHAYLFWNSTLYAEVGLRRTGNRAFSFMSAGTADADTTKWNSNNPYWRFAYSRDWGANSLMVGTSGMISHIFGDPTDPTSVHRNKDIGVDAQYQYLLEPHSVTVQAAYMRNRTDASTAELLAGDNASATSNTFRTKASYVYQAKYGGSVSHFNTSGTAALDGTPFGGTNGMTYELFWLPIQYVRVGVQYTRYNRFEGASSNYDGFGRDAKDNNTVLGYVWFAY